MGKSLIIKGADFSANGIQESVELDITTLVQNSGEFDVRMKVGAFWSSGPTGDITRCSLTRLSIPELTDISGYSKLRIDINTGYDYVLGVCRNSSVDTQSSWSQLNGTSDTGGSFAWVTDNQFVEVDLSPIMYITGNFRLDDNGIFPTSTVLSDIATFKLLP